jgi:hypothetical protein
LHHGKKVVVNNRCTLIGRRGKISITSQIVEGTVHGFAGERWVRQNDEAILPPYSGSTGA